MPVLTLSWPFARQSCQLPFPLVYQPSRTSTTACLPTPLFGLHLCTVRTLPLHLINACITDSVLALPAVNLLPLIDLACLTTLNSAINVSCLDLYCGLAYWFHQKD